MEEILGILFIAVGLVVFLKRTWVIKNGIPTEGIIIGYGNPILGTHSTRTYNYKVKYEIGGKEYIALSYESVSKHYTKNIPTKNLNRRVKIYYTRENPERVAIADIHQVVFLGCIMLGLGIAMFWAASIS